MAVTVRHSDVASPELDLAAALPDELQSLANPQTDLPRIARDPRLTALIDDAVDKVPTTHRLYRGDASRISFLEPNSVHLVVTSPPYWVLKEYPDQDGQLGLIADYEDFLAKLDQVWRHCFDVLVPGGRLVCVVGDVCLSRRQNHGRHTVVPLHSSIQERCPRNRVRQPFPDHLAQDCERGLRGRERLDVSG